MRVPCASCPDPSADCHACDQCEDRRTKCPGKTLPCACCLKRGLQCTRTPRMVRVRKHDAPDSVSSARRKRLRLAAAYLGVSAAPPVVPGPSVVPGPGPAAAAEPVDKPPVDEQQPWPFVDEDSRTAWLDALADSSAPGSLEVLEGLLTLQDIFQATAQL